MLRSCATVAIALAGFLVSACGGAPPVYRASVEVVTPPGPPIPLEVETPFFIPGEQMDWQLSLRGVVGGKAQLAIGEPGEVDGKNVLIIRSRVETTGVAALIKKISDDVTSWLNLDTAASQYMEANMRFGTKRSHVKVKFRRGGYDMMYHRRGRRARRWTQKLPNDLVAHEAHSVLAMLRAWRPADGTKAYFFAVGGRRIWYNVVQYKGKGTVLTAMGKRKAIRIEGTARRLYRNLKFNKRKKMRSYTMWISDDEKRLPLMVTAKTEYGLVKVELVSWQK